MFLKYCCHYIFLYVSLASLYDPFNTTSGKNRGDSNDVWHSLSSSSSIRPSTSSSGPYPNTDSYQGGIIKRTGICISDFGTSGSVMSFKVEFIGTQKTILSHTPDPFPKYIPKQEITTPMSGKDQSSCFDRKFFAH